MFYVKLAASDQFHIKYQCLNINFHVSNHVKAGKEYQFKPICHLDVIMHCYYLYYSVTILILTLTKNSFHRMR